MTATATHNAACKSEAIGRIVQSLLHPSVPADYVSDLSDVLAEEFSLTNAEARCRPVLRLVDAEPLSQS